MSYLSGYVLLTTSNGFQCSTGSVLVQRIIALGQCYQTLDPVSGNAVNSYSQFLLPGFTTGSYNFIKLSYPDTACSGTPTTSQQGPFTEGACLIPNFGTATPTNPDSTLSISTSFTFTYSPTKVPTLTLPGLVFTSYSSSCANSPAPSLAESWVYSPYQCYMEPPNSHAYLCYSSIPSTYWINTYQNNPFCCKGPGMCSYSQQQLKFLTCAAGPQTGQTDSRYLYVQNSCTNTALPPAPSPQPGSISRSSAAPKTALAPGALTGIGIAVSCFVTCILGLFRRYRLINNPSPPASPPLGRERGGAGAGAGEAQGGVANPVVAVAMVERHSLAYATEVVVIDPIPPKS